MLYLPIHSSSAYIFGTPQTVPSARFFAIGFAEAVDGAGAPALPLLHRGGSPKKKRPVVTHPAPALLSNLSFLFCLFSATTQKVRNMTQSPRPFVCLFLGGGFCFESQVPRKRVPCLFSKGLELWRQSQKLGKRSETMLDLFVASFQIGFFLIC